MVHTKTGNVFNFNHSMFFKSRCCDIAKSIRLEHYNISETKEHEMADHALRGFELWS